MHLVEPYTEWYRTIAVYGCCIMIIGSAFLFIIVKLWEMGMLPGVPCEQSGGLKTNESRSEEALAIAVWLGA